MKKYFLFLFLFFSASLVRGQETNQDDIDPGGESTFSEFSGIQNYLEPFEYQGLAERDPFEVYGSQAPLVPGAFYGPFLPLQQYNLSDLKLKGLFWNTRRPQALIADPKGKVHRVGIKDYVGESFGYVASIREKEVVLIQTLEEDGQRYSTTKILFLNEQRSHP